MPNPPSPAKVEAKTIYLKDASFESPSSPHIFGQNELNPKLDVQMSLTHQKIDVEQDYYEVVLQTTIIAKHNEDTAFLVEVRQAGIFEITHVNKENIEVILETACPHILLPFVRETVAAMISKGGFPQLLISPINFQALYHRKKANGTPDPQPDQRNQLN